jgi:hypothetical protein
MAASASSIYKSADAQNERNGIMVFSGKVDANDIEASEFFNLKRKIHLQKSRSEVEALSQLFLLRRLAAALLLASRTTMSLTTAARVAKTTT